MPCQVGDRGVQIRREDKTLNANHRVVDIRERIFVASGEKFQIRCFSMDALCRIFLKSAYGQTMRLANRPELS